MIVVGSCVEWDGRRNPKGYGQIFRDGKCWQAHRYIWAQEHGDPGDLCVLHACDNPACINIDHLSLGTIADNNQDMSAKGRNVNSKKTHCPQGHPYSGVNVNGRRICHTCRSVR